MAASVEMLRDKIRSRKARAGVVGLGYVGLPLAVELAKAGFHATGIDLDDCKVQSVNQGRSYIPDVSTADVQALHAKGLLASATTADQATEAQKIINDFGILPEQNLVQPGYWFAYVPQSISVTYANAYGRFSVLDNLCNYSLGATTAGVPSPLAAAAEAQIFGTSNGIPPTSGLSLINNAAPGGAAENRVSTPDQNLDGALCLRALATGKRHRHGHGHGRRRLGE